MCIFYFGPLISVGIFSVQNAYVKILILSNVLII